MRPIDRGVEPTIYTNYEDAKPDLLSRLGRYCSYCERQIETHLSVEHVLSKLYVPALRNKWSNFLLGCVNCNSCKGDTVVNRQGYLWPDMDNTLRALHYDRGGLVKPNPGISTSVQTMAQATIELVGLDKYPGNPQRNRQPERTDIRWQRRFEIWQLAEIYRQRLTTNDSQCVREFIVENALARGMFSIWWTVFKDDLDMRRRLREAFIGTDRDSFHTNEDLKLRTGGQV